MDIRQLRYLVALARERHFTRAAVACNVTQPTLSGRIRQLEEELGVSIVRRARRYEGLTAEGERVLEWARAILENCSSLEQDLAMLKGRPSGRARLAVVPSALPVVADLTGLVRRRYPDVTFSIVSRASRDIVAGLADFSLDAGITYLDADAASSAVTVPLYEERFCLFVGRGHPLAGRRALTWSEAAALPLGLLSSDMQNRRIIDSIFAELGCEPAAQIESNSVIGLYAHVRQGDVACILPRHFLNVFGGSDGVSTIPLVEPDISREIGLVANERGRASLLVAVLLEAAESFAQPEPALG